MLGGDHDEEGASNPRAASAKPCRGLSGSGTGDGSLSDGGSGSRVGGQRLGLRRCETKLSMVANFSRAH
jgi:hypothetical protein